MAFTTEVGAIPFIFQIEQDTAYEIRFVKPFNYAINELELKDDSNDMSKVRFSLSYSFDNVNWTPHSTNTLEVLAHMEVHRQATQSPIFLKLKVICDFTEEIDYWRLYAILINGYDVLPTDIRFSEIHNYRGITNSYTKNLFKPYKNLETSIDRMLATANKINEIFGHEVYYLKVKEDDDSFNATLKTFGKFKIELIKKIKVLVPENDFKANTLVYSEWGMEYEEDLKIHIVIEEFERAFGISATPQAKDIVYIPAIGRIYDVTSSTSILQLGLVPVYQECALRKYVASSDISGGDAQNPDSFDINELVTFEINDWDDSITPTEDSNDNNSPLLVIDSDNAQKSGKIISDANVEGLNAQALQDYYYLDKHERVRLYTHKYLTVKNQALRINDVPIFFRYYDSDGVKKNEIVIQYTKTKLVNKASNFNLSFWFRLDANLEHTMMVFYNIMIKRNGSKIEVVDLTKNEVVSFINIPNDDLWHFLSMNIDVNTSMVNFAIYEYDNIDVKFDLLREEFFTNSLIKINRYIDKLFVYSDYFLSNIKLYAKAIENDNVIKLAIDRNFPLTDSVIVDTVFDIKKSE